MNKYLYVLPTVFVSLNAFGSASPFGDDRDGQRCALTARPTTSHVAAPRELTPNEELVYAVKGYKEGVVALATLVNPLLGVVAAVHQPRESYDDLIDIRKALTKGADINCRDRDTWTPLMHAAYGGYPNIATFLIQNGARKDL